MSEEGIPASKYTTMALIDGEVVRIGYLGMAGDIITGFHIEDADIRSRILRDKSIDIWTLDHMGEVMIFDKGMIDPV